MTHDDSVCCASISSRGNNLVSSTVTSDVIFALDDSREIQAADWTAILDR